jgi:hypothetical protein
MKFLPTNRPTDNYKLVLGYLSGSIASNAKLVCTEADWKFVTKLGDIGRTPADDLISTREGDDREHLHPTLPSCQALNLGSLQLQSSQATVGVPTSVY